MVDRIHRLVNEFRAERGLVPLTLDPVASAQAREHSSAMARSPKGISHRGFADRIADIRKKISARSAAENVAMNLGHEDPAGAAVQGWKESPEHRKNMLGDFSVTGIGVARGEKGGYYFTQIFLQPRNREDRQ